MQRAMAGTAARALLLCLAPAVLAVEQRAAARSRANPIRKVVNMLTKMKDEVTKEGKKEEELYEKFMCYCKDNGGGLADSIEENKEKVGSLEAGLKESKEKKKITEQDLKEHQVSRTEAEDAMAKASAIREKEADEFAKFQADASTNVAALEKAIGAIEAGTGGSFLQTKTAAALQSFFMEKAELPDIDRKDVLAFLAGSDAQGYAPQSGQVTGILKQMLDEMSASLKDATKEEEQAIQTFDELTTAKKKEVSTLTAQVETEQKRIGELGVSIASMTNDYEDTVGSVADDSKFLKDLKVTCKTKEKEWVEIQAMRQQELAAISETIKVLNDDDALELFKKTLPSSASSLLQVQERISSVRNRALSALQRATRRGRAAHLPARPEIDLIALAVRGKKIGLDKVITMIGDMISNLKEEQDDDDHKKEYCEKQLDIAEDKEKELNRALKDSKTAIEEMTGEIETLTKEVAELEAGIKKLDKAVADATTQRKSENAEYEEVVASCTAAKDLMLWAKNRLNKFYNPKMYKPPPSEDIQLAADGATSFVQVSAHARRSADEDNKPPPPPPETFGAYTKKSESNTGVMAMMDLLLSDLEKDITEAKVEEKNSQEEYEQMLDEAAKKRADDSKSITDKTSAKAANEEAVEVEEDNKVGTTKELFATVKYLQSLHSECDWLLSNYDARKEGRSDEIEALGKAKDVLNGADLSLVQTVSRRVRGVMPRP